MFDVHKFLPLIRLDACGQRPPLVSQKPLTLFLLIGN